MWQTISLRILCAHPRLTVAEDEVLLPSGEATTYLRYVGSPGGVAIVCRRA